VRLKLTKATLLAKQKIATSGDSSGVQEFRSGGVVEWWKANLFPALVVVGHEFVAGRSNGA
jgi:hypothetical protein